LFNDTLGLGGNLTVTAGTGNATFTGAVTIGGHNLTVASSAVSTVTSGISGTTGNVDIAASTRTDAVGAIALSGAGSIELDRARVRGVDITTVGGNITFDGPTSTDTGAVSVSSGAGGGHVLFQDTLGLGGNLTVTSGTGNATFAGAVAIGGHDLTVVSSTIATVAAGISGTTGNVGIAATTRTDVDGAIALSGAGNIELDQAVISGVDVTTAGGNIVFDGPLSTDNGAVAVGTGAGGGDVLFNGTVNLGGTVMVAAGTGNVAFSGLANIGAHNLTVASSTIATVTVGISGTTGSVDIAAATRTDVDGTIALSGAGNIALDRAILSGVQVTTAGGTVAFAGPTSTDTGAVVIGTGAGGGSVDFNSTLTLGGNVTITAGTGDVDFDGAVSVESHDLTVVSSATTNIRAGITGSTSNVNINATTATHVDGAIALSGAGTVALHRASISGVDITTVGGTITFDGPTSTDTGTVAVGTGAGGGHVLFNDTLGLGGNLTVTAGTGNATFTGAVTIGGHNLTVASSGISTVVSGIGGTTGNVNIAASTRTDVDGAIALSAAGNIDLDRAVVSGVNVTTVGGNITFDGPASTDSGPVAVSTGAGGGDVVFHDTLGLGGNLMVTAGTGNATFSGAVTIGGHSLTVTSSAVTTIAAGISGTTGNVDIAAATRTDVDGAIELSGTGNIALDRAVVNGVAVTTAGGNITFDGPTSTDKGPVAVEAGPNGDVLFHDTLDLGANLTIAAGGVQFNAEVDSRADCPKSLEVRAGNGGVHFGGSVGASNPLSSVMVQTLGLISMSDDITIRTGTGTLSNLPLVLTAKEDPNRPFGLDGTTTQYLIVEKASGGSRLTVTWADETTTIKENAPGINVENLELSYEYPGGFVLQRVVDGRNDLTVILTLSTDNTIVLEELGGNGEPRNLATKEATVVTFLPAGQFSAPPQAVQFQPPQALFTVVTDVKPVEARSTGPTVLRVDEIQTAVEVTSTAARELVIVKLGPMGEEGESYLLPEDALQDLNGLFQRFVAEGLPNGRYRIYLRESGFPPRKLLEFYKSGRSIGDPVREPGPGSNPLTPSVGENANDSPESSPEPATQATAPTEGVAPETASREPVEQVSSDATTAPTDRALHPAIGAAAAASVVWQVQRTRGRWSEEVEQAMEQAEPNRFTRGARWWRRLTGRGNRETTA
ncbi:MAG: hypothetical protein KJ000_29660, partial [Pirellulaceae bacterium]|nr:hypothetical protein [Pirellulaceae bacterium]